MVVSITGGIGTKVLRKNYPVEEGLIAGTTKQTGKRFLKPVKTFSKQTIKGR